MRKVWFSFKTSENIVKKRKIFIWMLFFLLYFIVSTGNNITDVSLNLIHNGDFLRGTESWNFSILSGGEACISVKHQELYINIIKGGDYTYSMLLSQTGLKIEQGTSYSVSFDAYCKSGNRNIYVKIGLAQEPWTSYSEDKIFHLTTVKKNYDFKFTMLRPTDTNATIEFHLGKNNIGVYLDNIVVMEKPVQYGEKEIRGAKLPPTGRVTRKYPKLVNYFHTSSFENQVLYREERFAQWDVLLIPHDITIWYDISLSKIRQTNPDIEILVHIPFGHDPGNLEIAEGIPGENDPDNWYGKTVTGEYIVPHWGGHIMNPYKNEYAWPKHVINFVKGHYLDNGLYDGVNFDTVQERVPTFASGDSSSTKLRPDYYFLRCPPTFDTDEDGDFDEDDNRHYREGVIYLLKNLRKECPNAIITGNGGIPWTKDCNYYRYANGDMHENALGNQFGNYYWNGNYGEFYPPGAEGIYGTWDGYRTCMDMHVPYRLERYHFISSDIRWNRSQDRAKTLLELTDDDLRRMRLGLCTSLLDDGGYFGFDRGDCLHGQFWWFDEYDADLGEPVEDYKAGVYGKGVYSRKFEKGITIVNNNSLGIIVKFKIKYQDVTTKREGKTFSIPPYDARIYQEK